jgi:hypothetical protein
VPDSESQVKQDRGAMSKSNDKNRARKTSYSSFITLNQFYYPIIRRQFQ